MNRSASGIITTIFLFFITQSPTLSQTPDTLEASSEALLVKSAYSNITSTDAAFSLTRIGRSQLTQQTTPTLTLNEITRTAPGIWVNDRENFALGERITIRGTGWRAAFGVRGIQVVPLTVADGQSMMDIVDPALITSLELLRGPSSVLWGNSSGGVLYLTTRPESRSRYRLRTMAGSFGLLKSEFRFAQPFGKHLISGYSTWMQEEGYRDHSSVELSRHNLSGRFQLSPHTFLTANGALSLMPRANHPGSLTETEFEADASQARGFFASNNAGKEVNQGQLSLQLQQQTALGTLDATIYGIIRDLTNPLPFAYIDLYRRAGGLRSTLSGSQNRWTYGAGAELKLQHDDRANFNSLSGEKGDQVQLDQTETVWNQALFGRMSYRFADGWKASGGLRIDWLQFQTDDDLLSNGDQSGSRNFRTLSPSVGVSYRHEQATYYTNFSSSFEAPTTTELANRPDGLGGFNATIQPEQTWGLELGTRGEWKSPRLSYDLALYHLWINNLLLPFQNTNSDRTFFRNEGASSHLGAELLVEWQITPAWSALLNYNWISARFRRGQLDGISLEENRVPGIAPHRLFSELSWSPGPFAIDLRLTAVDGFPPDSQNSTEIASYLVTGVGLRHSGIEISPGLTVVPFLNLNNLLDARYSSSVSVNARGGRFFEPGAGRNIRGGISITL